MFDQKKESDICKQIAAPLAAFVGAIKVKVGDEVKANDLLIVLSAMKLEMNIKVPEIEGNYMVEQICVAKEQEVVEQALLIKLAKK